MRIKFSNNNDKYTKKYMYIRNINNICILIICISYIHTKEMCFTNFTKNNTRTKIVCIFDIMT